MCGDFLVWIICLLMKAIYWLKHGKNAPTCQTTTHTTKSQQNGALHNDHFTKLTNVDFKLIYASGRQLGNQTKLRPF